MARIRVNQTIAWLISALIGIGCFSLFYVASKSVVTKEERDLNAAISKEETAEEAPPEEHFEDTDDFGSNLEEE